KLLGDRRPQAKAFVDPGHPLRQWSLQPYRPRIASGLPYRVEHGERFLAIAQPAPPRPLLLGRRSAQQADGVLPVVPSVLAKFIQDYLLGLSARLLVTPINRPQILPSPLIPQPRSLLGDRPLSLEHIRSA